MIATNFGDLDTLFKDIQKLHLSLQINSHSSLDRDLLEDKIKLYYALLKNYAIPSVQQNELIAQNMNKIEEDSILENKKLETIEVVQESNPVPTSFSFTNLLKDDSSATRINKNAIDLKSLIDINTRFGLIQIFFKGNLDEYNYEINHLNLIQNLEEAQTKFNDLCNRYNISIDSEIGNQLLDLIKKRY